jgi:hypothetical protein
VKLRKTARADRATKLSRLLAGLAQSQFPGEEGKLAHNLPWAGVYQPRLFFVPSEFPRIVFAGNSSHCIKTAASEGQDYYPSPRCSSSASFLLY